VPALLTATGRIAVGVIGLVATLEITVSTWMERRRVSDPTSPVSTSSFRRKASSTRPVRPVYAVLVAGEVVVRQAQPSDARAIAEVSVASRRWSYRDVLPKADLDALSVEQVTTDFAEGLAELPPGSDVYVAELARRIVGYAYVLPSPDDDVPAGTSELGSLYVTEDVAGTGVAHALMDASIERVRAVGHGVLTLWVRRENGRARRLYEKHGMRPDGAERSRPHDVLPTKMHEVRYRMSLEPSSS
jgi:GNAT superfamily N-acetyltransferase